ncbi:metallophosphoesterase family protein, partial [Corynebacterium heidelbergense]
LWAVSDLHMAALGNRGVVHKFIRPTHPKDWLIVAGDIAENLGTIRRTLNDLCATFQQVIYTPGNHEIYARSTDRFTGKDKYEAVIRSARSAGASTPEDPYLSFAGHRIVPLFTLYDHSWRAPDTTRDQALSAAQERGIVLTDHHAIAPYVDIPLWCHERLHYSVDRLSEVTEPTVLVNHWPLAREMMAGVRHEEIALWSGTRHTQGWPKRYRASTVIHGHLHLPVRRNIDGVTHVEVSLGYPREWQYTLRPRLHRGLWPYPVLTEEVEQ